MQAWIAQATPAVMKPENRKCVCAPDPLLPDPNCILCFCGDSNSHNTNSTAKYTVTTKNCAQIPKAQVRGACALGPARVGAEWRKRARQGGGLWVCVLAGDHAAAPGGAALGRVLAEWRERERGGCARARPPTPPTLLPLLPQASVIKYGTGALVNCLCGKDPVLTGKPWYLCKCPPHATPNPLNIPTTSTYTNWPSLNMTSPPQTVWPRASGNYALCSMCVVFCWWWWWWWGGRGQRRPSTASVGCWLQLPPSTPLPHLLPCIASSCPPPPLPHRRANCTLNFHGASDSTILLAQCGCIIPTADNGLTANSLVDPSFILDHVLAQKYARQCPNNADSKGCKAPNSTPITKAITDNTICESPLPAAPCPPASPPARAWRLPPFPPPSFHPPPPPPYTHTLQTRGNTLTSRPLRSPASWAALTGCAWRPRACRATTRSA